jgi:hypothetical protein
MDRRAPFPVHPLCLALLFIAVPAGAAEDSDRHALTGAFDVSVLRSDSEFPSWLEHGNGKLRFDEDHNDDGLRFSRAFVDYRGRLADTVNARATLNVNDDKSRILDFTEAYLEWRPLPRSAWRFRSRLGGFYPKLSMENTDAGWSSAYGLSSSVINTWIGEELRIVGAEVRATRDFSREQHLSFEGGMFYGNDPTGAMLAWRGWAAHDRQTGFNGSVPMPPIPAIDPWNNEPVDLEGYAPANYDPFEEIDHHPGFYGGVEWQWGERARVKYVHYDNHANPEAETADELYAWQTWFDHVGGEVELPAALGLIGQWIKGSTRMGVDRGVGTPNDLWRVQDLDFEAYFLTLTRAFGKHRVSARYEWFDSTPYNDPTQYTNKDDGNVLAVSYLFQATEHLRLGLEYLQIATEHCDPDKTTDPDGCRWVAEYGLPRTTREDTVQVTVRWRFDTSL